jgi:uncharacterized membrane protein
MLTSLLETWNALYSNHAALRTSIEFMHIAGLVAGGGCAIAADLATVRAAGATAAARATELQLLRRTHSVVIIGLVAVFVSGVLLFATDVDTYLYSRVFWIKMALVALLMVNGALLWHGERRVTRGDAGAWAHLHYTAIASLVLWLLTTLAGAALPNLG